MGKYAKGIVAAVGVFCTGVSAIFADGVLTSNETPGLVGAIALLVITVVGVVKVTNKTDGPVE